MDEDYKKLVESLSDPDIKKKDYDAAVAKIDTKVDEVWKYICKVSNRKLDWWAFQNDVSYGRGDGSSGGNFDPATDSEFIEIEGDNSHASNEFYEYNDGFPTRFLWEDYQTEVKNHLVECRIKLAAKKTQVANKIEAKKARKLALWQSIQQKLTSEELKIIQLK